QEGEKKQIWLLRVFEATFNSWLRSYERSLDRVIRRKFAMLLVTFATIGGTVYLYLAVPKGFFPTEDTGLLIGITEGATDISYQAMVEHQAKVAEIIRADKAVLYVNSTVGVGGPNATTNYGRIFIALRPKSEREPAKEVMQRLRRSTNTVPGLAVYFQPIQNINVGGRLAK